MGRSIIEVLPAFDRTQLVHAYERPGAQQSGSAAGVGAVQFEASTTLHADFDVLIDFSTPRAALVALHACRDNHQAAVVGVTGFSHQDHERIAAVSGAIPVVLAPNMSLGINLCFRLIDQAAAALRGMADIDISDMHHRNKADAPSGTALKIGSIIASRLGLDFAAAAVYDARAMPVPRPGNALAFQTVRSGDIVGEHTVAFTLEGERVEITHRAFSRLAFARGAVRAALWVCGKPPGLYGMENVLGLQDTATR